jgi:L-seryl-tRNA(Ser) seleniumtransferase
MKPEASRRTDARRGLPSVDRLLREPAVARLAELYGRDLVKIQVQRAVEALRQRLEAPNAPNAPTVAELESALDGLPQRIARDLKQKLGQKLTRVLNATGIFLHTNLGRAPLPRQVARPLPGLLDAYCDLELDLAGGRRSERNRRAEALLVALTGAAGAVVVNNNAAALVLVLATFARDREVIVSRGELVEIGGSFRIPAILEAAGCRLVEVGSTNRTRLSDYEAAMGPRTGLLLKVFPSNYRMSGFVASVEVKELLALGRRREVPLLVDEGSGLLRPHPAPQLADHPSLRELMEVGCDLACGSGDKLLGGPQAGLLVGRGTLVERCRRHPLYRALRPDRGTFAALEAVLRCHLAGEPLPLDRLWIDPTLHRQRLARLAAHLGGEIVPAQAFLGGGSAPEAPVEGEALTVGDLSRDPELPARLRKGSPPVIGYVRDGRLILDLRTVDPEDDDVLADAVLNAVRAT